MISTCQGRPWIGKKDTLIATVTLLNGYFTQFELRQLKKMLTKLEITTIRSIIEIGSKTKQVDLEEGLDQALQNLQTDITDLMNLK
jgi:hypothetical protein